MRRGLLICLALAALTLGVYWPLRNYDLVNYDDPQFITNNPLIEKGLTWPGAVYAFTTAVAGNWHPVTTMSHMLDCQLFGIAPGAHHLVNVACHMANAVLLFLVFRGLTGSVWRSALVAALFALHPLRVESVAWISERKDVLSGFFFLLTLLAYSRYAEKAEGRRQKAEASNQKSVISNQKSVISNLRSEAPGESEKLKTESGNFRRQRSENRSRFTLHVSRFTLHSLTLWYALALLAFTLGLMSKPMLVTTPFVLLLLDYWPLGRFDFENQKSKIKNLLLEKVPFFLLSTAVCFITFGIQKHEGAMSFFPGMTWQEQLANAVTSYVRYLGKLVWPMNLSIIYPHPAHHYFLSDQWRAWQITAAGLALVLISLFCLMRARRQPWLAVGWFWFLGTLVPVIGLVQVGEQAMADRYTYIPLIGPVVALVWTAYDAVRARRRTIVAAGVACASVAIAALGALSSHQVHYWQDTVTLFEHAIAVTADNPSAHFALGGGLEKRDQVQQAIVEYRVTLAIDPSYSKAHYNLGQIFRKANRFESAAAQYEAALRCSPNDVPTRLNFASTLQSLGKDREALAQFEEALRIDPSSTEGLNNLAWLLATCAEPELRDGPRAVALGERACALSEYKLPIMIGTLAAAYAEAGRFPEAVAAGERALAAASAHGDSAIAAKNQELLALYRANKPYHEEKAEGGRP